MGTLAAINPMIIAGMYQRHPSGSGGIFVGTIIKTPLVAKTTYRNEELNSSALSSLLYL
jgi:hypothetical protein